MINPITELRSADGVRLIDHNGSIFYYLKRHSAPWECRAWGLWKDHSGVAQVISSHVEIIDVPVFTTVAALHAWMGDPKNPITNKAARVAGESDIVEFIDEAARARLDSIAKSNSRAIEQLRR